MMKLKALHITSSVLFFMTFLFSTSSCLKEEDPFSESIQLKASVTDVDITFQTETKGEGVLTEDYNKPLSIGMVRIDEGDAGYPLFTNPSEQIKATMTPGKKEINLRKITFDDSYQQFKDGAKHIRYASWYPFIGSTYSRESKTITTPIDGNTDIMYGTIATGSQNTPFKTIYFDHALCKYTFKVYGMVQEPDDPNKKPGGLPPEEQINRTWGSLKSISLLDMADQCIITLPLEKGEKDKLIDEYTVNYSANTSEQFIPNSRTDGILLDQLPIGKEKAAPMPPLMAAPPKNNLLKVKVITDNAVSSGNESAKTMTIARNFQPGKNYEIILRFSDHGLINAEVAIGSWQTSPDEVVNDNVSNEIYYDLSSTEKANSYIVTSANYSYCFDVFTKGNGPSGILDGTDDGKISPTYLDIIWMDENLVWEDKDKQKHSYIELKNHAPVQNRVLFSIKNDASYLPENKDKESKDIRDKTLSQEGNVLIGAYDKKGGNLLWAWHVWLTDRPQEQAFKNGFVVLDRDLGAVGSKGTDPAKDFDGLYYQWGRPTPLPLGRTPVVPTVTKEGKDIIPIISTKAFKVKPNTSSINVNTWTKHPKWFYTNAETLKKYPFYEWLWGYNPNNMKYNKTIFDPCPPGYRLASKRLFDHMEKMTISLNKTHKHTLETTVEEHYNMFIPLSGYYTYSENEGIVNKGYYDNTKTFVEKESGAYLWSSSTMIDSPSQAQSHDYYLKDQATPDKGNLTNREPTDALPVRCVSKRSMPEVTNLSSAQTANCYIISKDGHYKFDATVRGNGINKLVSPGNSSTIDISETLDASLVADQNKKISRIKQYWWMEEVGKAAPTSGTDPNTPLELLKDGIVQQDGYVYFKVKNFRKGNLILAGVTENNEILWTWHLWFTDEPAVHKSYDFAVMDRFLGATQTLAPTQTTMPNEINDKDLLKTIGLFYQWGRKDPFPGPGERTANPKFAEVYTRNLTTGQWSSSAPTTLANTTNVQAEKTVANSVAHPTRFHKSTDNILGKVWPKLDVTANEDAPKNQCFSNLLNHGAMWGYSSGSDGFGRTTTKTMYDPCPPGYCVAYYLIWTEAEWTPQNPAIFTNKDGGMIRASDGDNTHPNNIVNYYQGKGITLRKDGFDKTWYPYTGFIDSYTGTLKEVNNMGIFQTSTPGGNGGRNLYYTYIGVSLFNWSPGLYTGQALTKEYIGVPSSFAIPVRCQKE